MNQEYLNQLIRVYNNLILIDVRGENAIRMAESLIIIKDLVANLEVTNQMVAAHMVDSTNTNDDKE